MLSVIIPVYNKEKYIRRTLESIVDLRMDDYEVICVDDGSTDGSRDILSGQDIIDPDRIRIFTIENSGPGSARNYGLDHCNGDYILFCDADDQIVPETVARMYESIRNSHDDVVLCDYQEVYDSGIRNIHHFELKNENDYFALIRGGIAAYAKIYKKDFLVSNQIRFNDTYQGEDRVFLGEIIACKPRLSRIGEVGYTFYRHETDTPPTLTHCYSYEAFSERIDNWKLFYDACKEIDPKETKHNIALGLDYLFRRWLRLRDEESVTALSKVIELCDHVFDGSDRVTVFGIPLKDLRNLPDRKRFSELYVRNKVGRDKVRTVTGDGEKRAPMVSVIIPIHNSAAYLDSCLSSIMKQSFRNFELILIDDHSDDVSYHIAELYRDADPRITLFQNEVPKGAGYSRNRGLDQAKGKYLLFLDSDDFFDEHLIEKTVAAAEKEQLDVLIFNATVYFEAGNRYEGVDYMLKESFVPEERPFAGVDADYIFNLSTAAPWNKLFRKAYIEKLGLRYMSLTNSNDVYFVYMAMALAERIDVLFDRLVYYRQSPYSTQATKEKAPLCWYEALTALREGLIEAQIFEKVKKSYLNYALSFFCYNLTSLKEASAFESVYMLVHDGGLKRIEIDGNIEESVYEYNAQNYIEYKKIMQLSPLEYMFEKRSCESKARAFFQSEFYRISHSWTYRVGNAITIIPRRLRKRFRELLGHYRNRKNR